jgi:hypothetical protein
MSLQDMPFKKNGCTTNIDYAAVYAMMTSPFTHTTPQLEYSIYKLQDSLKMLQAYLIIAI